LLQELENIIIGLNYQEIQQTMMKNRF